VIRLVDAASIGRVAESVKHGFVRSMTLIADKPWDLTHCNQQKWTS
jgi:hypothetical protein